jgi:hypothetical protein
MGEMGAPEDHAAVESPTPEVTMTVVVDPAIEVARASTAAALALVVVSMAQPTSSSTGHASSSLRLEDDVVLQFDATHHLSELTAFWGRLVASAASFGEQLQVRASSIYFCSMVLRLLLFLFLIFLLFMLEKSFSWDHSSFFSSGETEKKLSFEVSSLKMELVLRQAELESESQDCQTV